MFALHLSKAYALYVHSIEEVFVGSVPKRPMLAIHQFELSSIDQLYTIAKIIISEPIYLNQNELHISLKL